MAEPIIYTSRWAVPYGVRKLQNMVEGWSVNGPYTDHQRGYIYFTASHRNHTKGAFVKTVMGLDCFERESFALQSAIEKLNREGDNLRRRSAKLFALADKYKKTLTDAGELLPYTSSAYLDG